VIYYQYDEFEDADKYFSEGLKYEPANYLCVQGKEEIKKNELQRKLRQRVKNGREAFEKGVISIYLQLTFLFNLGIYPCYFLF
jgi:hypothetical protein